MLPVALLLAFQPAHAAETFEGRTYYWGDPHAHTAVSGDGNGNVTPVFDVARQNGLDWVALTDHQNNVTSAADFNALLARCRTETSSSFVCIPSAEFSGLRTRSTVYGHKNLYVFQDNDSALANLDLADFPTPTIAAGACATDLYKTATSVQSAFGPSLFWAHHETASAVATTTWACHSNAFEPVVEVYSSWGNALTYLPSYDPPSTRDNQTGDAPVSSATVQAALDQGIKVGFVAGTDEHESTPGSVCSSGRGVKPYGGGVTGVSLLAGAPFVRSAIYGELVAKRSLASTGPRVPVSVTWTAADGVHGPGETLALAAGSAVVLTVRVPTADVPYVTGVQAIGSSVVAPLSTSGGGVWSASIVSPPAWLYVAVAINGSTFYPKGCSDGGTDTREYVWSSPTWFTIAL